MDGRFVPNITIGPLIVEAASFDGYGECFIETGDGKAGLGRGNFYAEPTPQVKAYKVGRHWHAGKLLFEKDWLRRWF